MVKLTIGLYKNKETGQFDVMIDQIDNSVALHNGEFKLIKKFTHHIANKQNPLRKQLKYLKEQIQDKLIKWIDPAFIFSSDVSIDNLDDEEITLFRADLYNFMLIRRKLLGVNEYIKMVKLTIGLCSKCRTPDDEVLLYKDGTIIPDNDIDCIGCDLKDLDNKELTLLEQYTQESDLDIGEKEKIYVLINRYKIK